MCRYIDIFSFIKASLVCKFGMVNKIVFINLLYVYIILGV